MSAGVSWGGLGNIKFCSVRSPGVPTGSPDDPPPHPKSHSLRHDDPIGWDLSKAARTFIPRNSFLAFLTFCGNRLTFVCAAAATRATLPALRRLPTPGALRLRICSLHAPAIAFTACLFRSASAGDSTSGALVYAAGRYAPAS